MEAQSKGLIEVSPGVELYHEIYGTGIEKVLFIMGLGTSGIVWTPNIQWLLAREPEYQACLFDNRGIGRSTSPPGRYTTTMMAADALALVNKLGWDKFHVVGISMGGMISQELSVLATDRILSLTLAATHSGGSGSFPPIAGLLGMMKSMRVHTAEEKADIILPMMYSEAFLNEKHDEERTKRDFCKERYLAVVRSLPPPNPAGYFSQVKAVGTHSFGKKKLEILRNSKIPICICTGTADLLVSPKASHYLRSQLNPAEFIVWPGAGHGLITEKFEDFNQAVLRNLKRANPIAEQNPSPKSVPDPSPEPAPVSEAPISEVPVSEAPISDPNPEPIPYLPVQPE